MEQRRGFPQSVGVSLTVAASVLRQPAWVLHRRPYRETSAIVDLLTAGHGRIAAVARGTRRARRPQAVEPFARLEVGWHGAGRLRTLTACEAAPRLALAGRRLFAGMYLNELLMRALPHEEAVAPVFDAYEAALSGLQAGAALEPALRSFEKRLLRELGYELAFDAELATGAPIEDDRAYEFVGGEGFRAAPPAASGTYSGAVLRAIAADAYDAPEVRRAAKGILRRALGVHVGERPLASRELFRAVPS